MGADYYRRQIAQLKTKISRLSADKSKIAIKVADARRKALDAENAGARSKSASTQASKAREALRHRTEEGRQQNALKQVEVKILAEERRLRAAEKSLVSVEATETKKEQRIQQRANQEYEREMSSIHHSLDHHAHLHQETAREIDKLKALPDEIVVAFFASDPGSTNDNKLALDEEARLISIQIRASKHRDAVKLESRWAVRPMDLLQAVNELRPTVVHFSGHGSALEELILQDEFGQPKHVPKEAIVQTLSLTSDSVKLVFFNTCFSRNQAQGCVQKLNAAIGMNRDIQDVAARIFAAQFYSAIGFGLSIPIAFEQAVSLLKMECPDQADIPALYLKEGVDDEDLILVRPPTT